MGKSKTPPSAGKKLAEGTDSVLTRDAETGCIGVSKKRLVLQALNSLKEATTVSEVVVAGSKAKKLIREYRSSVDKCA